MLPGIGPGGVTMNASEPVTIPGRVNDLEQITHTLVHRMTQLETERLPTRMNIAEQQLLTVADDVVDLKEISRSVGSKVEDGIRVLQQQQDRQHSFVKGILWAGGAVLALLQFAPALSYAIKKLAEG